MDVSSNSQLVPYYQGAGQLQPYTARVPSVPTANSSLQAAARHTLMHFAQSPGYKKQPDEHTLIYTSRHRIKIPKMRKVGSLIDIYA